MSCEENKNKNKGGINIRYIAATGVFGALSAVLMMLSFSVPFMPAFIKLDFSELPALITAFSMGPVYGVAVCLIKNLINLPFTTTGGIGELANFVLGCCLVLPAGLIYKFRKNRISALVSALIGSVCMAAVGLASNYFVMYPIYQKFLPIEQIINMYAEILPGAATFVPAASPLFNCLLIFNVPFTFLKGAIVTVITFLIYKRISPIIKGIKKK